MSELQTDFWRRCSSCKKTINYSSKYYVCSVSTCNRKRIGYVFDSVHCWERHLPGARHRDAAAVEMKSPTYEQWKAELEADGALGSGAAGAGSGSSRPTIGSLMGSAGSSAAATSSAPSASSNQSSASNERAPQRMIVKSPTSSASNSASGFAAKAPPKDALESEILIVVSKLKNYIRERSEMNTSDSVAEVLSNRVRRLCDRAIEKARADGRKTVMDRDFE